VGKHNKNEISVVFLIIALKFYQIFMDNMMVG
jgi:hypothetical protein